jgi:hypothetical protein
MARFYAATTHTDAVTGDRDRNPALAEEMTKERLRFSFVDHTLQVQLSKPEKE